MALDARTRSSIYEKLKPLLGEHDANALMSQFPAHEHDELVTKQFLRAELAELRTELHDEIGSLRTELHDEIGSLRTELHDEIGALRTELHQHVGSLRTEIADRLRRQTAFLAGTLFVAIGTAVGIARAFS
jgi:hypothetical protein